MKIMRPRFVGLAALGLALCVGAGAAHAQGRGSGDGPPGLAKKGGLPPGQAKKIYRPDDGIVVLNDVFSRHGYTLVRMTPDHDSRIVFYRYKNGPIRRAIVRPGPYRLVFVGVPDIVLREVVFRMY
jgi:hypothetical protein